MIIKRIKLITTFLISFMVFMTVTFGLIFKMVNENIMQPARTAYTMPIPDFWFKINLEIEEDNFGGFTEELKVYEKFSKNGDYILRNDFEDNIVDIMDALNGDKSSFENYANKVKLVQFGDGVIPLDIKYSTVNMTSGTYIFSGKLISSSFTIYLENGVDFYMDDGEIIVADGSVALYNYGGTINIGGGLIMADGSSYCIAISNYDGEVNIYDGTVLANGDYSTAINNFNGTINISNGMISTNGDNSNAVYNSEGLVNISDGIIECKGDQNLTLNNTDGEININGGVISSDGGIAINSYLGEVTVSGENTLITSNSENTIFLYGSNGLETKKSLHIEEGTIENTYYEIFTYEWEGIEYEYITGGTTICNYSERDILICGGIIVSTYIAITNYSSEVIITGGIISAASMTINNFNKVSINNGEVNVTGEYGIAISNSLGEVNISGGSVSAIGKESMAISNSYGELTISNGNVSVTGINSFAIRNDEGIVNIIDGKIEAMNGNDSIAVANYGGEVNIAGGTIITTNGIGVMSGFYGASRSIVTISGGLIEATSGCAVNNYMNGELFVVGGTIKATTGTAIFADYGSGNITISQDSGKTTLITSQNTNTQGGTVVIWDDTYSCTFYFLSGTIENTALTGTRRFIYLQAGFIKIGSKTVTSTISYNITGTQSYTGVELKPTTTFTATGLITSDYIISYSNNVNIGTATINWNINISTGSTGIFAGYFTINKGNGSGSVTMNGWTYGNVENNPIPTSSTNGTENVTYNYRGTVNGGVTNAYNSSTKPTQAGTYTVTATFAQTNNYNQTTASAIFTIARATGTGSVTINDWIYSDVASVPVCISTTNGIGNITYNYRGTVNGGVTNAYNSSTKPTQAGTYTITATFAQTNNYNQTTASAIFTIARATITTLPTDGGSKVYNGSNQTSNISGGIGYTIKTNIGGINAGEYDVTLAVDNNHQWGNEDITDKTIKFTITPKIITLNNIGTLTKVYDGNSSYSNTLILNTNYTIIGLIGTDSIIIVFNFILFNSENVATASTVTASYEAISNGNYSLAAGNLTFNAAITRAIASTPPADAGSKVYNGSNQTSNISGGIGYAIKTNIGGINAGEYDVTLAVDNNHQWGNEDITDKTIKFTITPKIITLNNIGILTKVYDGNSSYSNTLILNTNYTIIGLIGTDSVIVVFNSILFNSENVATASTVTASYESISNGNYSLAAGNLTFNATITRAIASTPPADAGSKVYNGSNQTSNISGGIGYTIKTNIGGINAGEYDVILAVDSNHQWGNDDITDKTIKFTITKATGSGSVTLEGWVAGAVANIPIPESPTNGILNVTYEYKVKDASDNTYTSKQPTTAGEYTLRATFSATTNYESFIVTIDFLITETTNNNNGLSSIEIVGIVVSSIILISSTSFIIFYFNIKKKKSIV